MYRERDGLLESYITRLAVARKSQWTPSISKCASHQMPSRKSGSCKELGLAWRAKCYHITSWYGLYFWPSCREEPGVTGMNILGILLFLPNSKNVYICVSHRDASSPSTLYLPLVLDLGVWPHLRKKPCHHDSWYRIFRIYTIILMERGWLPSVHALSRKSQPPFQRSPLLRALSWLDLWGTKTVPSRTQPD